MNLKSLFGFGPSADYKELIKNGALIIDVRTPGEFAAGHIKKSKNIPLNEISKRFENIKKENRVIILVCRSGMRSGQANGWLKKKGIKCHNGGAWDKLERIIS